MKEKLDELSKNHTWDLVTLPPKKSMVGCKWTYKIKICFDGSVEHYKVLFCCKMFYIGVNETFLFVPFKLLLLLVNETFFRCMSKMPSLIGI